MKINGSIQLQPRINGATASNGADPQSGSEDDFDRLVAGHNHTIEATAAPTGASGRTAASVKEGASTSDRGKPAAANANTSNGRSSSWALWLSQATAQATGSGSTPAPLATVPGSQASSVTAGTAAGGPDPTTAQAVANALDPSTANASASPDLPQQDKDAGQSPSSASMPTEQAPAALLALLGAVGQAGHATRAVAAPANAPEESAPPSSPAQVPQTGAVLDATAPPETATPAGHAESIGVSKLGIENHVAPAVTTASGPDGQAAGSNPTASALANSASASKAEDIASAGGPSMPSGQLDASALTTIRTIANGIVASAGQQDAAPKGTAPAFDTASGASPPPAARTMTLELSPAHLGTVSIRLHVTGQTLDVELSVSSEQTLGLVSRERDALASALRDQSYDLNSLVIQSTMGAAGSSQDQYPSNQGGNGGGTSADGSPAKSGSGSGDGTGRQRSAETGPKAGREALGAGDSGGGRGGGLFV